MHRIQHSVLHHLGPFLIAISRPGAILSHGAPEKWRHYYTRFVELKPVRFTIVINNKPVVAGSLFVGLIVLWLAFPIHFIAMLDWRLYRVMNWGMAINGLFFWNLVLNNYALRPAHLSPVSRIFLMLAIIPPQIIIGMLIFVAPHELYPIYSICGRAFTLSALADQQMGGLILWIPAAMMSVIGMMVVIRNEWLTERNITD